VTELGIHNLFSGARGLAAAKANGSSRGAAFKLRQMGDRCRNRRNWQEARENYSRYLQIVPEDAAIWVQYGHACHELGDLEAAKAAYEKSIAIMPSSDSYLSLGRVLKAKGEITAAGVAFRKVAELEAGFDLGAGLSDDETRTNEIPRPCSDATVLPKRVLIDLTDVIFYLHHHNTVTGIQRVQLGLAEVLLRRLPELPYKLTFVCDRGDGLGWLEIDNPHLETLVQRMSEPVVDHEEIKEFVFQIKADAAPYEPKAEDLLLILGAFWVVVHQIDQIAALQNAGVITGVLIHDLIPITHPEYCEKGVRDAYQLSCDGLLRTVDFVLTVSDHSAQAVDRYLRERGFPSRPITTLRLAHGTGLEPQKEGMQQSLTVKKLLKKPYVLYVSTIEVRKNHIYLFQIWKRLQYDIGERIPRLIFVGRTGWRINDLIEGLENSDFLEGTIEIVSGLTDPELATLYQNCLFTVFPSFEEGWGLPVGESLIFGRPCLASHTSSLPEVAGGFADYFDPFNITDGYEKIKKFILDNDFREFRATAIKTSFLPRLWGDVANDLLRIVRERAGDHRMPHLYPEPPELQPGVVYEMGHGGDVPGFVRSGRGSFVRGICGENWYGLEAWGRWMRGHSAALCFRLREDKPHEIMLLLELRTVAEFQGIVRIMINDALCNTITLEADAIKRLVIKIKPKDRTVRIDFESTQQISLGDDPRQLSLGVSSLAYAGMNDLAARLSLIEESSNMVYNLCPPAGLGIATTDM
jgi:glycosyltransferase involved in cell wall biosynthesis